MGAAKNLNYQTLVITDVVDGSKGVTVRGMQFDAEYNVVCRKSPGLSGIEIDSHEVGPISIIVDKNLLLLDQNQLKNGQYSLYNAILAALEAEALHQANNTPDYKWKHEEYGA